MLQQIQKLIESSPKGQQISHKDFVSKLQSLSQSIENSIDQSALVSVRGGKLNVVNEIKRYDLVYVSMLGGIPHYFMVHKVVDDKVYCVCFTSTVKNFLLMHKVTGDRLFKDTYVTNTYYCLSLEECKKSFVRVYEDKREAVLIFNKINRYYKSLFK